MIFTHDLKFYTDATQKLEKAVDEFQLANPKRRYIAIRRRIQVIDAILQALAKPFTTTGRSMGKQMYINAVLPLMKMRGILQRAHDVCKPQPVVMECGGFTGFGKSESVEDYHKRIKIFQESPFSKDMQEKLNQFKKSYNGQKEK